jgi:MYXO-CTERM domain-containing protein
MNKLAAFVIGCALTASAPRAARACGGFFCSQVPVDQSGEQILFSVNGSHVTAHIQISYQGAAKDFAWVVPVAAKPTITLGSKLVFQSLVGPTQPSFSVLWPPSNQCGGYYGGPSAGGLATPTSAPPPSAPDKGVTVLDMSQVGSFETYTLESHDSSALVNWLNDNHFTQPPSALPLIDHYVKNNWLFVAVRLSKDATTGEIQPLVFDMDTGEACVPLILTRIAALPDMPVQVYMLGKERAVPRNWFEVEVNQRQIDWFSGGSNYVKVATAAINDAAGHGFITEYAGSSSFMKNVLYSPDRYSLASLAGVTDRGKFLATIVQIGLPRDATMLALLRKYMPLPPALAAQGITEQQFYNTLATQPGAYAAALAGMPFDAVALTSEINERVIKPLQAAQSLFDSQPYLTRLFSTVSPDEMTRDPLFQFNGDLKSVSNNHRALATGTCGDDGAFHDVSLIFENGDRLDITGPVKPYGGLPWAYGAGEPAARRIDLAGTTGAPTVYSRAQTKLADGYLDSETPEAVRTRTIPGDPDPVPPTTPVTPTIPRTIPKSTPSSGGCSMAASGGTAAPLVLLGLGIFIARRRRR